MSLHFVFCFENSGAAGDFADVAAPSAVHRLHVSPEVVAVSKRLWALITLVVSVSCVDVSVFF